MITKKLVTQLSYDIIGCAITVHKKLGPGLLESVYQKCLKHELVKAGFLVKTQIFVPLNYDGIEIETKLRIDFI
jgi:GxxExxY protein